MYQIIDKDGKSGEPVDLPTLKQMAGDGRLEPQTLVFDPISGQTLAACDMFVHEELFAGGTEPIAAAAASSDPVEPAAPALEPSAASLNPGYAPAPEPARAIGEMPAYVSIIKTPYSAEAPAPPAASAPAALPVYPTLATEGIPDLGARFIGLLIDGLIGVPLHLLAIIPIVGIVMAPIAVGYWLSRDAFFGGQSIGKRVAKTRVIRLDGSPFTWAHSALRNIVYLPILALVIPFFGIPLSSALLGPCLLAELICVLLTQRRIGDYLANTQVVRAE